MFSIYIERAYHFLRSFFFSLLPPSFSPSLFLPSSGSLPGSPGRGDRSRAGEEELCEGERAKESARNTKCGVQRRKARGKKSARGGGESPRANGSIPLPAPGCDDSSGERSTTPGGPRARGSPDGLPKPGPWEELLPNFFLPFFPSLLAPLCSPNPYFRISGRTAHASPQCGSCNTGWEGERRQRALSDRD